MRTGKNKQTKKQLAYQPENSPHQKEKQVFFLLKPVFPDCYTKSCWMPLESFSATQCLLSSAICLLKTADILIGHLYCDNTWKYTPIKCKNQPNCELHCGQEIHSPQLLNYIFKEILHHRKSEPRNVNHWTVIYWERFKLFLKQQQNKCCSTEVHKHSSLVLQYSSKPGGFFVVPPPFEFSQMPNAINRSSTGSKQCCTLLHVHLFPAREYTLTYAEAKASLCLPTRDFYHTTKLLCAEYSCNTSE